MIYPKPSLTADVVAFRFYGGRLQILLIERGNEPFKGSFALPGGFVEENEPPIVAAARELEEETSLRDIPLYELGVFGDPGRDPRGWTATAAYLGFAPQDARAEAGDDAAKFGWFAIDHLPPLAFDHQKVIEQAILKLRDLTQISTLPLALLKAPFQTKQARHLYSQIWGRPIVPTAFKAWLRRREAVIPKGVGRFVRAESLREDWLR